jgi:hypothetical protein
MYFVLIILYEYFLVLERIIWVSIISYGEIRFDIRVLWITSTFPERIMLANQGTAALTFTCLYEEQIINYCRSECPSLRPTHAGHRKRGQRTNSSAGDDMNPAQIMQAPAIYSYCVPDTQKQASYLYQTPQLAS